MTPRALLSIFNSDFLVQWFLPSHVTFHTVYMTHKKAALLYFYLNSQHRAMRSIGKLLDILNGILKNETLKVVIGFCSLFCKVAECSRSGRCTIKDKGNTKFFSDLGSLIYCQGF